MDSSLDNHDLPDADDNKEYDKIFKLEFGNYETEVSIEKPHSNGYVFMEENTFINLELN
jgi:hypothetical protein